MCSSVYLYALIGLCVSQSIFVESKQNRPRMVCTEPDALPNGRVKMRRAILQVICDSGFMLQGQKLLPCIDGKWFGEKPVCAKRGCANYEGKERYPRISSSSIKATAVCPAGYELFGNTVAYCNGTSWDRELGICKVRKDGVEFECDFEGEDLCGWVSDEHDYLQWSRTKASHIFTSVRTGPHHDHTTMSATGGHYMLMESTSTKRNPKPIMFISPIYNHSLSMKTACCFRFYYFMYGTGVGSLSVYVKPISLGITEMLNARDRHLKFIESGNRGDRWHEANFDIDETEEDFQIVFTATTSSAFSDIAIDDLKLMIGPQCGSRTQTTSADSYTTDVEEEAVFDSQTCASRCMQRTGLGYVEKDGHMFKLCNCHAECVDDDSCCPDFKTECLEKIFYDSTSTADAQETTVDERHWTTPSYQTVPEIKVIVTTTKKPTTTTTTVAQTTTTTKKPIRITTTTTTKKPTTTTTTKKPTTTSTTKKPTTTTTTTKKLKTTTTTTTTPTTTKTTSTPKPKAKYTTTTTNTLTTKQKLSPKLPLIPTLYNKTTTTSITMRTTTTPVTFRVTTEINNTPITNEKSSTKKSDPKTWSVPTQPRNSNKNSGLMVWMTVSLITIGLVITVAVVAIRFHNNIQIMGSKAAYGKNATEEDLVTITHSSGSAHLATDCPEITQRNGLMQGLRAMYRPKLKMFKYGARDTALIEEDDEVEGL